jgi:SHS2 domain-containing protein
MQPSFEILEHPSDLGIEARGSSLAEAFQNAAIGLMSVILDISTVEPHDLRKINIEASDNDQLLVKWLSEILYLYDGQDFVCKEFHVHEFSSGSLQATVRGEVFSTSKHTTRIDVKAVTYHQLCVRQDTKGGLVRVFLDI